jgi:hypothetical protein
VAAYIFLPTHIHSVPPPCSSRGKQELLVAPFAILGLLVLYFLVYRVLGAGASAEDRLGVAHQFLHPFGDLSWRWLRSGLYVILGAVLLPVHGWVYCRFVLRTFLCLDCFSGMYAAGIWIKPIGGVLCSTLPI